VPAQPDEPVTRSFDLDTVIEAWPLALESLKAPLRAAIHDAQPIGIENGVIIFGVPRRRSEAIQQRFRSEADAIKQAFTERLGATPKFLLRPHDFDAVDAFRPLETKRPPDEPEPDEPVDLDELVDARDDDAPVDSVARLMTDFGAEVIEERPRD
jgi:hypothetical protein